MTCPWTGGRGVRRCPQHDPHQDKPICIAWMPSRALKSCIFWQKVFLQIWHVPYGVPPPSILPSHVLTSFFSFSESLSTSESLISPALASPSFFSALTRRSSSDRTPPKKSTFDRIKIIISETYKMQSFVILGFGDLLITIWQSRFLDLLLKFWQSQGGHLHTFWRSFVDLLQVEQRRVSGL